MDQSRNPIAEGTYILKPAAEGLEDNVSVKVDLIKYAGRYRMRLSGQKSDGSNVYLTAKNGNITVNWITNDEDQVFVILRNKNGTYTICRGSDKAFFIDGENTVIKLMGFTNYPFQFNTEDYDKYIAEKPGFTWKLVPAS